MKTKNKLKLYRELAIQRHPDLKDEDPELLASLGWAIWCEEH